MHDVLRIALTGMTTDGERMASIGRNVANINTPGYLRKVLDVGGARAGAFEAQLQGAEALPTNASRTLGDISPGALQLTGRNLDFALSAGALFVVQTPDGPAYTRDGRFHRDAQNRLVSLQGYPVLSTAGEILLDPQHDPELDSQGRLRLSPESGAGAVELQAVQLTADAPLLTRADGLLNLAGGSEAASPVNASTQGLRQGQLAQSNVNLLNETLSSMQTVRHFESMQRVAQIADDMLGMGVKKLGEF